MLDLIKKAIGLGGAKAAAPAIVDEKKTELLAAVFLLEAARSDYECSENEMTHAIETMKSMFGLPHEYVEELLSFARSEREKVVDIYHYTRQANEHLSRPQKISIMEAVWRVIQADGQIDKHEEHFARKLANLLWLDHKTFIEAKLRTRPQ